VADCLKAIEMAPEWAENYAVLAKAHARRRDYGAALDACKRLLTLFPTDPRSYTQRASVLVAKGDYQPAAADANHALELDAANVPARLQRGRAYTFLGNSTEALLDLNAVIKSDPRNPQGYAYRALLMAASGKAEAAEADADRAVELSPTAEYLELRGELELNRRGIDASWSYYARAEKLRAGPRLLLRLGQIYGTWAWPPSKLASGRLKAVRAHLAAQRTGPILGADLAKNDTLNPWGGGMWCVDIDPLVESTRSSAIPDLKRGDPEVFEQNFRAAGLANLGLDDQFGVFYTISMIYFRAAAQMDPRNRSIDTSRALVHFNMGRDFYKQVFDGARGYIEAKERYKSLRERYRRHDPGVSYEALSEANNFKTEWDHYWSVYHRIQSFLPDTTEADVCALARAVDDMERAQAKGAVEDDTVFGKSTLSTCSLQEVKKCYDDALALYRRVRSK
jgi:tetratricopeptide (TPR) repeat protein